MLSNNSKGKLPDPLKFVAPQRFVASLLVQTLTYIDNLLPGTELEVHTISSPDAATLRPLLKGVRVLTLPYLEFEYCNVYRGTYGKTLPLIHRHPDAIVILWSKGDHDHVFFLTMSQLLPCLKDMQATNWSLIVFWNESKGPAARRGPGVGLDFTDQPASTPAQPPQPPTAGEDVDYPGYDDPHGDTPVDDEDMPPPTSQQPEPDLDDDPVELHTGGGPPSQPPGGGAQVPVPGGDHDDSDLEMPLDSEGHGGDQPPGGGPQGPGPGYGPSPDEPPMSMEYHDESPPLGGFPGAPGAVPQFANPDQVLSPPIPWPAPPSQINYSCSYSTTPAISDSAEFETAFASPCVPGHVLVALIRTTSPRRSLVLLWVLRLCCCLVSRQERRILLLHIIFRFLRNPLLRRLIRLRFRVCR